MDPSFPNRSRGCDLPREIISLILSLLPTHSISKFRSVCKLWHKLITSDPLILDGRLLIFQTALRQASADKPRPPVFDFIAELRGHTMTINYQVSRELRFFSSCNGLLYFHPPLHSRSSISGSVCNPLLCQWLDIPNPERNPQGLVCGFFYHKTSDQYRLLSVTSTTTTGREIYEYDILALGSESWRRIPCNTTQAPMFQPPVILNHVLHWLSCAFDGTAGKDRFIMVFDTEAEDFQMMQRPRGSLPTTHVRDYNPASICHIMDMDGCLSFCQRCSPHQTDIWVLKGYTDGGSWERKYIITLNSSEIRTFFPDDSYKVWKWLQPIYVHNGEIVVYIQEVGLVYYDIAMNSFKSVSTPVLESLLVCSPTIYQRSQVSLLSLLK